MTRTQTPSLRYKKTTQHRLETLGTVLLVLARTIGFAAVVIGIFKGRRKGTT